MHQKLSFHYPSDGRPPLNVTFPAGLVPSCHPAVLEIALLVVRRGGFQEGTNTAGKVALRGGVHRGFIDGGGGAAFVDKTEFLVNIIMAGL
jgi:hypothetical protein